MDLYLPTLLQEIGMEQEEVTMIIIDNNGAYLMAAVEKPTRRTRHIDICHFTLQDWVENDLIILDLIPTGDNTADMMTKGLERLLFHRHRDNLMGNIIPPYVTYNTGNNLKIHVQ